VEIADFDEHTSLLHYKMIQDRKKFFDPDPWGLYHKTFYGSNSCRFYKPESLLMSVTFTLV
jgi:hypothetical protein